MSYKVRGGGLAWMPPAWVVEPALVSDGAANLPIAEQVNTMLDDKRVGKLVLCSTTVLTRRSLSGKPLLLSAAGRRGDAVRRL